MKIAIYIRQYSAENEGILDTLLGLLNDRDRVYVENEILNELRTHSDRFEGLCGFGGFEDLDDSFDVMLTIGGDGTLLKSIGYIRDLEIPVMTKNFLYPVMSI